MKSLRVIGEILAVLASALGLFIVYNVCLMFWQLAPITAPFQYENVLRHRWLRADLVAGAREHEPSAGFGCQRESRASRGDLLGRGRLAMDTLVQFLLVPPLFVALANIYGYQALSR